MRSIKISQEGKRSLDGSSVNMKTYDFQFDKAFRSFNTNSNVNDEVAQVNRIRKTTKKSCFHFLTLV